MRLEFAVWLLSSKSLFNLVLLRLLNNSLSSDRKAAGSPTPPSSSSFSSTLGEHDLLQGTGMSSRSRILALFLSSLLLLLWLEQSAALDEDGVLLLQFKYSLVADPLDALGGWNYDDATPCAWNGVMCMGFQDGNASRVVGLVLPNSKLAGGVPWELGLIGRLRHLELSGNALNGTLPASIFNSSELRVLSLANNEISGGIPELPAGRLNELQVLNLSDNALVGKVPIGLALLPNLTTLAIANNYLSGGLPAGGFGDRVEYVDLSANLISGSLPPDLGGQSLRYLNLSRNQISGVIPPQLASGIPANSTVDFAFNNLTGEIPQSGALAAQGPEAFAGNSELCGKPLENHCTIPSTLAGPPNSTMGTQPDSPPAFAAMPRNAADGGPTAGSRQGKLRPAVIIAIAVGDVAGIGFLGAVFYYFYKIKKNNREQHHQHQQQGKGVVSFGMNMQQPPPSSSEPRGFSCFFCCLRRKRHDDDDDDEEEDSEYESTSSGTEAGEVTSNRAEEGSGGGRTPQQPDATLIAVDGETELEMETLLKASAYILGASGSSIVYKAVLGDGTALAVRRIGESSAIDKLKDFEAQVRSVAKLRHPNLLRLRGFYWSAGEKLVIHDYVPNGSLANISFTSKKQSSSPFHLSWESRLRIAQGVARGLAYLHEKKSVHGNVKPSNILLDADMEPKIADFGLDRLLSGDGSGGGYRLGTSARLFGSKRSLHSQGSLSELSPSVSGASPLGSSASASTALYQPPEFLKSLKPSAKSDVYSFGMVLLEMLAGRMVSEVEVVEWNSAGGLVAEERHRVVRMADPAMRGEVEGKEEALMSCFRLGFACCAAAPQKRPAMKEVVQVLEKLPPPSSPPFC